MTNTEDVAQAEEVTGEVTGELAGRHALVTGASRGIGRVIASHLASHGARVSVHGRDAGALAEVCAAIEADGGTSRPVTGDLTDPEQISGLVRQAEDGLGGIDVLVANAGGSPSRPMPVEQMRDEDFVAAVELNLIATYRLIAAALAGMKERGRGSIVTISSAASRRITAYSPIAYAAAKSGVETLTKGVALQAGPDGVRANCVSPETIITERTGEQIPQEMQQQMIGNHPVRRLGTPLDVAEAVLYLASDRASWVSGIVIDVAGGSVVTP